MSAQDWKFEAAITNPDGIRTHVTITLPDTEAWSDIYEVAEQAAINAQRAQQDIAKLPGRAPF